MQLPQCAGVTSPQCSPSALKCSAACLCLNGWVSSGGSSCAPPSCLALSTASPLAYNSAKVENNVEVSFVEWSFQVSSCDASNAGAGLESLGPCDFKFWDIPSGELNANMSISDLDSYVLSKSESVITISNEAAPDLTYKTLILLDTSGSLVSYWSDLITGVQSLLTYLQSVSSSSLSSNNAPNNQVAIAIFHGSDPFDLRLNFTADLDMAAKTLKTISPYAYSSTPFYAAINDSLNFLDNINDLSDDVYRTIKSL
ncbi:hypothetical protein HK096_000451, partial [Nowakowskiella sp. JEL0078]